MELENATDREPAAAAILSLRMWFYCRLRGAKKKELRDPWRRMDNSETAAMILHQSRDFQCVCLDSARDREEPAVDAKWLRSPSLMP